MSFLARGATPPAALPIADDGATFNMAQEVSWVDTMTFAVGRWDGTLSLFRFNDSPGAGPLVTAAVSSPAMEGVQMIVWMSPRVFVTSNDDGSMAVWSSADGTWMDLRLLARVSFDARFGVANSGEALDVDGIRYLAVGHANGYLSLWRWLADAGRLELQRSVDLRADKPTNPWGLHNIRGVAALPAGGPAGVVTGSENGSLCVIDVTAGTIRSRAVYNPNAERGINSVTLSGTSLLVANCAVGPTDFNLWSYAIDPSTGTIVLRDRARMVVDPSAPQVFNFCTIWGKCGRGRCFFSSTEEGALWMGTVGATGNIELIGYRRVTSPLGAALAYNRNGRLVLVAYDLHEYKSGADDGDVANANPEMLS